MAGRSNTQHSSICLFRAFLSGCRTLQLGGPVIRGFARLAVIIQLLRCSALSGCHASVLLCCTIWMWVYWPLIIGGLFVGCKALLLKVMQRQRRRLWQTMRLTGPSLTH